MKTQKSIDLSIKILKKVCFIYLGVPFLIFCFGFLKIIYSFTIFAVFLCVGLFLFKQKSSIHSIQITRSDLWITLLISGIWVLLSGIGGYTFQNFDFSGRNAFFRDLINYDWPVFYKTLGTAQYPESTHAFVYYFGYWLLPALFGKLFGWDIANLILYLYTTFGVLITIVLISTKINVPLWKSMLLLIFFSGMDIVAVFVLQSYNSDFYPTLWPPISHLEWWRTYQFSSFTTQLFWVFNQAVPAWVCTALIINLEENKYDFYIWSLCFFFAPMPSLGLAVIVAARFFTSIFINHNNQLHSVQKRFTITLKSLLSFENIVGGGVCVLLMYLFYHINRATSMVGVGSTPERTPSLAFILFFSVIEWLLLWIVVNKKRHEDLSWYLMAIVFILSLVITISGGFILSRRATIAPLFLLMVWAGEFFYKEKWKNKVALSFILLLGAFTPLYEINRSIYRSVDYYLHPESRKVSDSCSASQEERIVFPEKPEYDHPGELLADDWCSLSSFDFSRLGAYVSDTSQSFFFNHLAKK